MNKEFNSSIENFFKNYQDRGMKKWAGYFLSDHVAKLTQDEQFRNHINTKKEEMSQQQIGAVLLRAYSNHYSVKVQLKEINREGDFSTDVKGFVEGYQEDKVIINGNIVIMEDINNVLLQN